MAFRPDEEEAILCALRHRMITAEVIQRAIYGAVNQKTRLAVEALLKRLRGIYLESAPLYGKFRYYRPTSSAARLFGVPEECAEPLGPQALPKALAYLVYCYSRNVPHLRLTRPRLQQIFPDWEKFLPKKTSFYSDFCYADMGNQSWISRMQVDLGGDFQRCLNTCWDAVQSCQESESIRGLIDEECFRFTILTGDERKKESLQAGLDVKPLGVPTHIFVVPGLLDLIGQSLAGKEEPHVTTGLSGTP